MSLSTSTTLRIEKTATGIPEGVELLEPGHAWSLDLSRRYTVDRNDNPGGLSFRGKTALRKATGRGWLSDNPEDNQIADPDFDRALSLASNLNAEKEAQQVFNRLCHDATVLSIGAKLRMERTEDMNVKSQFTQAHESLVTSFSTYSTYLREHFEREIDGQTYAENTLATAKAANNLSKLLLNSDTSIRDHIASTKRSTPTSTTAIQNRDTTTGGSDARASSYTPREAKSSYLEVPTVAGVTGGFCRPTEQYQPMNTAFLGESEDEEGPEAQSGIGTTSSRVKFWTSKLRQGSKRPE
jgi:hypothetical protein